MATYEATIRTAASATNVPIAAFRASTTQRAEIKEIGLSQVTAGTSPNTIAIARSLALTVTPSGALTGLSREPAAVASGAQLQAAWTTAPTFTANAFFRRWTFGGTVGSGFVWTWDITRMLTIPIGSATNGELVFINLATTTAPTFDLYVCWEE